MADVLEAICNLIEITLKELDYSRGIISIITDDRNSTPWLNINRTVIRGKEDQADETDALLSARFELLWTLPSFRAEVEAEWLSNHSPPNLSPGQKSQ